MNVTTNANGGHSPAYDETWPPDVQLEWHAGIVALDTGLRIQVTKSSDIRTGVRVDPGLVTDEKYHLRISGPKTSVGIGPVDFHAAWNYLDGVSAGARASQT